MKKIFIVVIVAIGFLFLSSCLTSVPDVYLEEKSAGSRVSADETVSNDLPTEEFPAKQDAIDIVNDYATMDDFITTSAIEDSAAADSIQVASNETVTEPGDSFEEAEIDEMDIEIDESIFVISDQITASESLLESKPADIESRTGSTIGIADRAVERIEQVEAFPEKPAPSGPREYSLEEDEKSLSSSEPIGVFEPISDEDLKSIEGLLIYKGAEVNARDSQGMTALMHAARDQDDPDSLRKLLQYGANPNIRDENGMSALLYAAKNQENPEFVSILLDYGAEIEAIDLQGMTPLLYAIRDNKNPDIASLLINYNANVNAQNKVGWTALLLLTRYGGDIKTIEKVLEAGAEVDRARNYYFDNNTPLMFAVRYHKTPDVISLLLEYGAEVNATDSSDDNITPLMYAVKYQMTPDVISLLLKYGAEVNATDSSDDEITPLMYAARYNDNLEIINILIEAGADVNKRSGGTYFWNQDMSPLLFAAQYNRNPNIIAALLLAGADGGVTNKAGETAFELAKSNTALVGTDEYWMLNDARLGVLDLSVIEASLKVQISPEPSAEILEQLPATDEKVDAEYADTDTVSTINADSDLSEPEFIPEPEPETTPAAPRLVIPKITIPEPESEPKPTPAAPRLVIPKITIPEPEPVLPEPVPEEPINVAASEIEESYVDQDSTDSAKEKSIISEELNSSLEDEITTVTKEQSLPETLEEVEDIQKEPDLFVASVKDIEKGLSNYQEIDNPFLIICSLTVVENKLDDIQKVISAIEEKQISEIRKEYAPIYASINAQEPIIWETDAEYYQRIKQEIIEVQQEMYKDIAEVKNKNEKQELEEQKELNEIYEYLLKELEKTNTFPDAVIIPDEYLRNNRVWPLSIELDTIVGRLSHKSYVNFNNLLEKKFDIYYMRQEIIDFDRALKDNSYEIEVDGKLIKNGNQQLYDIVLTEIRAINLASGLKYVETFPTPLLISSLDAVIEDASVDLTYAGMPERKIIINIASAAAEEVAKVAAVAEPVEVVGDIPAKLVPVDFSTGWELGKQGGEFVRSTIGSEPKTFNGVVADEPFTTDVTDFLTAGAIGRDQFTLEYKVNEGFGKSFVVSEDELTLTVEIEEGLKWSDGDDLTAEDIVFSLNQLLLREDIGSNSRSGYMIPTEIDGYPATIPAKAELIDMYTYKLTLPTIRANIVELAGIKVYPMHIFGPLIGWDKSMGFDFEYAIELTDDDGYMYYEMIEVKDPSLDYGAVTSFWGLDSDVTEIVSAGPFVISEYVPGQKIVLGRNPNYYEYDDAGVQLPYLDKVTYIFVEDQDTQLARFLAGELDFLGLRGSDYAVFTQEKLDALDATLYDVGPVFSTQFLVFNQKPDAAAEDGATIPGTIKPEVYYWTSNREFRVAMAHLIDRETIINNVAFGFGYPQYSFIPRVSPYYWEGADDAAAKYDPEMAKDILDDLGWVDTDGDGWREDDMGRKIVFELTTNSGNTVRESIGTLFAEDAASVGVQVQFKPEDFNTMVGKLLSGQGWDAIIIGLTGSVDPISESNVHLSSGNLHMTNPNQSSPGTDWEYEVDQAWNWANNTTDEEQRKLGLEIVQRVWLRDYPWIFTFNASAMNAFKNDFGNIYPQPIDEYGWKGVLHRLYLK